jgi:hypothetical protein
MPFPSSSSIVQLVCCLLLVSILSFIARVRGTFATCTLNKSDLAGDVLLLLLLIRRGLGPEPGEVVVQVLQKAFCRPLHKGNYLSVITTVNLINVT